MALKKRFQRGKAGGRRAGNRRQRRARPPRTAGAGWLGMGRARPRGGVERLRLSARPSLPGPGSPSPTPIPAPRADAARDSRRYPQLLVEPGLAAGLEVADDNAELPDVLHELLQVLLQVVELLCHGPAASPAAGTALLRRFLLPPGHPTTSVSSSRRGAGLARREGRERGRSGARGGA